MFLTNIPPYFYVHIVKYTFTSWSSFKRIQFRKGNAIGANWY